MKGGTVVVTSVLDLVGSLLLVVALAVFLWPLTVAGALAASGVAVLVLSVLIDWRGRPKGGRA